MPQVELLANESELMVELLEKYESLVWYARSRPADDPSWADTPEDIRTGALNSQAKVEEMYPDEVDKIKSASGDWEHGFNSGMLACLRLVLTSKNPELLWHEDDGTPVFHGGVKEAIASFPELDT